MAYNRVTRGKLLAGSIVANGRVASKAAAYTVTAEDTGTTFISTAVDVVFTLPSTAAGLTYTFVTGTLSATTGLSLSPAAADKIMGAGVTSVDDKDIINTAATDRIGDSITIMGDGSAGWYITAAVGTYAIEA